MPAAFYSDIVYRKNQSSAIKELWKNGKYSHLVKPLVTRYCQNIKCDTSFKVKPYTPNKFCSKSCATIVNNLKRTSNILQNFCVTCGIPTKRSAYKYCSNKCQNLFSYREYISKWKLGLKDGNRGINAKTLSKHLRRYLLEKYKNQCSVCGWDQKHSITNVVPLEVDHIDGNSENNKENNLRLICPNCHSLSPNFRNLNKGNGRQWRIKYLKTHHQLT